MSEYAEWSNRETLVCVQIEDAEAVENIEEIVGVEGVDVFFVGPSDLSQSLGYPGRSDHPLVREAMERVFDVVASAGKVSGCAGDSAATRRYRELGVGYLYTHLTTLLREGVRGYLMEVEEEA